MLALVMVVSLLPAMTVTASAEETTEISWALYDTPTDSPEYTEHGDYGDLDTAWGYSVLTKEIASGKILYIKQNFDVSRSSALF